MHVKEWTASQSVRGQNYGMNGTCEREQVRIVVCDGRNGEQYASKCKQSLVCIRRDQTKPVYRVVSAFMLSNAE